MGKDHPHPATMIGRSVRTLPTGCGECGASLNLCECTAYFDDGALCCRACTHNGGV